MKYALKIFCYNLYFLLLLAMPVAANTAFAAATNLPNINASIIRDTARVTFEWPQATRFKADADGKTITITFDRTAKPDFGMLLSQLYPYVNSAERKADNRTIVLHLDKPYKIRTFEADNISGIDILGIDPDIRAQLKNSTAAAAEENGFSPLSPSAGDAGQPAGGTATDAEALASQSAADVAKMGNGQAEDFVKISVSASRDSAVLRLPLTQRMALAVYTRNNALWVILGKGMQLDLSDFDNLQKTVIGKAEVIPGRQTIIRIPIDDNIYPSVTKEDTSFEWAILLTPVRRPLISPLRVDVNTDPPAPPNVFINSLQMGDPITVTDPLIGDQMVVTPLYKVGEGVGLERDFVEFTALQTAQGVVIAKKADDVSVVPLRNGLRISLPYGTTLTPGLPAVDASSASDFLKKAPTLFNSVEWKYRKDIARRSQIKDAFRKIVENGQQRGASEQRRKLAEHYIDEGLYAEALGLLEGIARTDPSYYRSEKLAALHGASNFMMYRFSEAMRDFNAAELNNNKEVDFWRNILAMALGNPARYDFLDVNRDYISKYPVKMRQSLVVLAADQSVENKDYNQALKIFDTLSAGNNNNDAALFTEIKPYVDYLFGKIAVDTGQVDQGLATWEDLIKNGKNAYLLARADFSRSMWEISRGKLTGEKAIDKLEKMRLNWRGDLMELKILEMLGNLYIEGKDYVNAMRVWDNAVSNFPSHPTSIEMARKMQDTFALMFSDSTKKMLPPMEALSLYYQYKNYAPTGRVGRQITMELADRLVAIDLLEQAAALLERQMRFDADKIQRSRIGARIAEIYLMGHLPRKALKVLQDSVYGETPSALQIERNRLTAKALFELDEPTRAWNLLSRDDSIEAERIRLAIHWQRKDWSNVIKTVEGMLRQRQDVSAAVSLDESEDIIRLALAYIFENDTLQLQYLRDYFGPLMAKNPNKPMFDFVTSADVKPTATNFDDVIKQMSDTRSFVNGYKAHIELAKDQVTDPAQHGQP